MSCPSAHLELKAVAWWPRIGRALKCDPQDGASVLKLSDDQAGGEPSFNPLESNRLFGCRLSSSMLDKQGPQNR
jgi:hypothetical protein